MHRRNIFGASFFCSYIPHGYRRDYGTISKVLSIIVYNCRYYVAKKNYLCNHIKMNGEYRNHIIVSSKKQHLYKKMIFATDKGRMCNNILQYGHVYAWAREHDRKSISMRFCYKYQYFKICHTRWHNFITYVLAKYAAKWGLISSVIYNDFSKKTAEKNEEFMLSHKTFIVKGWEVRFYDLFLKYKQEILNLFAFNESIVAKTQAFMGKKSENELRLGIHIRRGDYKTWQNGKYYYEDDIYQDYIIQFQKLFPEKIITAYICSNDPKLNKESYKNNLKNINIIFPQGGQEDDLCLLSECDYLIGAPSTFSLVASMYHNTPLCWMEEKYITLTASSFDTFDELFKNIK